jgi:hypothetical protein
MRMIASPLASRVVARTRSESGTRYCTVGIFFADVDVDGRADCILVMTAALPSGSLQGRTSAPVPRQTKLVARAVLRVPRHLLCRRGRRRRRQSCQSMITLSGTFKARESCDWTRSWSIFSLNSQAENALASHRNNQISYQVTGLSGGPRLIV